MGGTISTLACEVILYLSTAAAAEFLRHFDVTKFDRSKFFCHIAFFCTFCIAIKNVIPNKMTYIHILGKLESKNFSFIIWKRKIRIYFENFQNKLLFWFHSLPLFSQHFCPNYAIVRTFGIIHHTDTQTLLSSKRDLILQPKKICKYCCFEWLVLCIAFIWCLLLF